MGGGSISSLEDGDFKDGKYTGFKLLANNINGFSNIVGGGGFDESGNDLDNIGSDDSDIGGSGTDGGFGGPGDSKRAIGFNSMGGFGGGAGEVLFKILGEAGETDPFCGRWRTKVSRKERSVNTVKCPTIKTYCQNRFLNTSSFTCLRLGKRTVMEPVNTKVSEVKKGRISFIRESTTRSYRWLFLEEKFILNSFTSLYFINTIT